MMLITTIIDKIIIRSLLEGSRLEVELSSDVVMFNFTFFVYQIVVE